ncbi:rhamnosyltransferase [Kordiimonas sediminis]|uniref:Rhamnosyltransferase n=1 Tax=Kordiimonas sediminis TaxID=1735581 RepID=A0A919AWW7_9PROT|nr:ferritin-like domain-containing protein [Kordiimonas sediminis]GHF27477.1 rhamnosyltransferase [Kordiimonas sediminis]
MSTEIYQALDQACLAVLSEPSPMEKASKARQVKSLWMEGALQPVYHVPAPKRPARPARPVLMAPGAMPKRRKGGNLANKQALLHAVAHIELNAIDLAFDIVLRFGGSMPKAFTDDWLLVGDDEARHFMMLEDCLSHHGISYGDLPAHDGLWESAIQTSHDLDARLAIVPMVLEARGLDVTPDMIKRFERFGDHKAAEVLGVIYEEEKSHVEAGSRWFKYLCGQKQMDEEQYFHQLVRSYFAGSLKPPFNKPARDEAGMPPSFYEPLVEMLRISN